MARPIVTASTERIYRRLPQYLRDADAREMSGGGYPLLRYIALVGDELGKIEALVDRLDYVSPAEGGAPGDTSALVDPQTADLAWLPWLGRLVGVNVDKGLTVQEQREAVEFATSGFRAGTKQAMADAAKTALNGTRYAKVYDHSKVNPGDGTVWDVLVVTRATETPDVGAVLGTIIRKNTKPAGAVLHHRAYEASWGNVETAYPTWDAIEAAGSWDRIQEAGL